uniref:Uncharacterized protein n=1 Tax=Chromera velia CCMP2878 TaxID=1169474 RepID=A0A0G4HF27_9ALVE|eukprot:Cvel_26932.t1-p1 / transcript=Cvel_26932.t1 / gene=Cvel_26932 / organism=Chromera_velia_CCMP2878 / gene_product=hypothetical protein / transcript_product=hypothetical protein / location=Cvel_scaffold3279:1573-2151(+) / protein_length=193 / sequence_SO=supercontig / SO=protein_coding / is_pseudo=false
MSRELEDVPAVVNVDYPTRTGYVCRLETPQDLRRYAEVSSCRPLHILGTEKTLDSVAFQLERARSPRWDEPRRSMSERYELQKRYDFLLALRDWEIEMEKEGGYVLPPRNMPGVIWATRGNDESVPPTPRPSTPPQAPPPPPPSAGARCLQCLQWVWDGVKWVAMNVLYPCALALGAVVFWVAVGGYWVVKKV